VKSGEKLTAVTECAAALMLSFGLCVPASAQDSDALNVDLSQCVGLATEQARFECYQERVDAALENRDVSPQGAAVEPASPARPAAAAAPAAAAVPATPAAAPAPTAPPIQSAARTQVNRSIEPEPEPEEIFGTIAALQERGPNIWVITLDNGQIWAMNLPRRYPLRVGQDVKVYPTQWGSSYRLTVPEHGSFVQVERVR